MRWELGLTLAFVSAAIVSSGQQGASLDSPGVENARPDARLAYFAGPDVTSPELIPSNALTVFTGKCNKQDGSVEFALIVDPAGRPRQVTFSRMLATDVDRMALQIVLADRFKPGAFHGEPAAVIISLKVSLQGCNEQDKNNSGQELDLNHLRSQPVQEITTIPQPPKGPAAAPYLSASTDPATPSVNRVGGGVTPPMPLNSVSAEYTNPAREAKINGICIIQLIVDSYGLPQNPRVVRSLDKGLDQNALKAVRQYRFKPAMKGDQPVAVMITVEVNFKLY